jgi:phosphoenolpyruvate synthase/pyruvate phosphate dikinase
VSVVKFFAEIEAGDIELVGGKGLSLGLLTQAKIPVPAGYVITTDAYKEFDDKEVDSHFTDSVLKAFDELGANRVAVRSSAIAEDSPDASWAGQFDSYLNVGRDELLTSIIKCWDSASSEIVESYAESSSTTKEQLAIAVVIQKMVDSEVSGVAFSVNPINKNSSEIMIEATYGLGELLVQGMVTPDNYIVNKNEPSILEKTIKTKLLKLVFSNGVNVEEPVPEYQKDESCLSEEQTIELAQLVVRIENYYGKPQDVEWALNDNTFSIVQSRPITTL